MSVIITTAQAGQRIDNFLLSHMKGVPKTRIYKAMRKGEVRVNKKRVQPTYRIQAGDEIRIPPIRMAEKTLPPKPSESLKNHLLSAILFENDDLLIINKPAGLAVHGGSGVAIGLIEALKQIRGDIDNLYLIHRLDRDTSGCLLLAKHRDSMLALQAMFRSRAIKKQYQLVVHGHWPKSKIEVNAPLLKITKGDERIVVVDEDGKSAQTVFQVLHHLSGVTLLEATLITGRMHQIRVHAAHAGHPIIGDRKYGDRNKDRQVCRENDRIRLYLHAQRLSFEYPESSGCVISVAAPGLDVPFK